MKKLLSFLLGILLLPVFLLRLLFGCFKKRKKTQRQEKQFSVPYKEPVNALPDAVFAERIGEFTCLQFFAFNGLSGGSTLRELIAADHPAQKETILAFLQTHPIMALLQGERYESACDADHWELHFIFDDTRLNRVISGYGHTTLTFPYLCEMCHKIPLVLSKEEQAAEEMLRQLLEMEMQNDVEK